MAHLGRARPGAMGDYIRNLRDSAGPVKGERAENSGGGQTGGGKNTWHDQYPTDEDKYPSYLNSTVTTSSR